MEGIELITREEQEFIHLYYTKLKSLQEKSQDKIVYTKIPMTYAIINKLSLGNIVFHPISLSYCEHLLTPSSELIKNTIREIIEFELYAEENLISKDELDILIKHYGSLNK